MSVSTFWSESRWGREYGWRPGPGQENPYTLGYHIAQDIQGGAWIGPVPVLRAGVIVQTGRSSKIGGFVTIRADEDGLYDTYCHLNTTSMPRKQLRVSAGDSLPKLARSAWIGADHDYMGSASTGPHCHFAITRTIDGAYNLRRGDDRDPRPIIRRALSGQAAGGGSKPFVPAPPLEDDDMLMLKINKTHLVALGVGVFRHFIESDPFDKIMKVSRIQDDWQDITLAELPAFLRTYGCDLNIWDVRNGQFVVLDPLTGGVGPGNVWTSTGAARGQANGIASSIQRLSDEVAKINADYVAKAA